MSPTAPRPVEALEPGTAAYRVARAEHRELVARLARARTLQAQLPEIIFEAEHRLRELDVAIGVPATVAAAKVPRQTRRTRADVSTDLARILAALPGTSAQIADDLGLMTKTVDNALRAAAGAGLCRKEQGYNRPWHRVIEYEEAA